MIAINLGGCFEMHLQPRDADRVGKWLKAVWDKGFGGVRIPITWCETPDMTQVDFAIHQAVSLGFSVLINAHHENWCDAYQNTDVQNKKFAALWTYIAKRYKSIPLDKLAFEIKNEPKGSCGDFNGGADPRSEHALMLVRALNAVGYKAVRAVDAHRRIYVSPNAQSSLWTLLDVYPNKSSLPGGGKDANLGITVHSYDPFSYCGPDGHDISQDQVKKEIDKVMSMAVQAQKALGIIIHFGEFGVGRKDTRRRDSDVTRFYYNYFTSSCLKNGFAATVWDDGTGSYFQITHYDGHDVTFPYGLADASLRAERIRF